MRESLRKSGIDIIGDVPWGTHFCQFYQTKEDLMDILVPYFKAGLENNEFCLWVMSQPLEVEEAKEALRKVVPDIDVYMERGQIEIIPYTHGYINEDVFESEKIIKGWVKKFDQVLSSGYDGLRTAGDTPWLKKGDWDDFVDYEKEVDANICKRQRISLFPYFLDTCSAADIIDMAFNHQFALIKKEGKWERIENFGRKNITERKRGDEALRQSEQCVRLKLESILPPARETANLELAEIVDTQAIQSLMDDFYEFAHITIALVDLKGNVLVSIGWQDICTRFHRVHPDACKHCVESDTKLSAGVPQGEFKLYRCKNNMWDTATPIMVGGQHVGNIFSGQFFFEDEPLDYELFRSQARQYGFDEEEYIAALEKVPRLSPSAVATGMAFFAKLANMLSQLSYSNIKLAHSLAERDTLVDALRESEERERSRSDELAVVLDAVPAAVWIAHDPQALQVTGNRLSYEWIRIPEGANASRSAPEGERPEMVRIFKDGVGIPPANMPVQMSASGIEINNYEFDFVYPDGGMRHVLGNARPLRDEQGNPRGSVSAFIDITEREKAEEAIRLSNIYNRSLIEASLDPMVTIGPEGKITDVNGATELITGYSRNELIGTDFSDYFTEPEKARTGYQQVFTDGKVWDYSLEIQHKDEHITPVLYNASVYRGENGEVIGVFAAARDITEREKAEEALKKAHDNLEKLVEERTMQLEKAYTSLKESETGLAEAQRMAHIGNWNWNIAIGEKYWSDEVYRIFGLKPQEFEVTYDTFLSYVHPDDRDYVDNATKEALKGKPYSIDFRIILADGEERIAHEQGEVVFDEKNIPIRMKGTTQDITERKKSEEKIEILANAVESSNDAIATESLEGTIASWNKGAEQIYGYSAEEIIGKNASIIEPNNIKGEIKQLIEKIKQGEPIQHYETLRLKKDGTIINVSVTMSSVFDATGELVAISAIARDITENKRAEEKLRESEEKYRNIVETAKEGIFIIDAEALVTYANKKMTDMLGYTLEEMIGRYVLDFISEEDKNIVKQNMEKRRQGVNESYELKLRCKDGSFLWLLVSAKSLFDKDGKFMGSINMLTDITKRKKAEEALANIEIARKQEIHHRIKNNLQVISSLLDLQAEKFNNREDIKDSEVLEAFRESQDRVISMALIHEELYKGGGFDTLNFSSYIEELAENLFQTYSLGNADISLNMDLEENIFFDMDIAVPLGIIVNELVSNSLKHAFPGRDRGEIRIQLCREEKNNEIDKSLFSLTISDNGKGIPENVELESFESLGLQLVSILVDQLDGKIEIQRGQGAKFSITFNVAEGS